MCVHASSHKIGKEACLQSQAYNCISVDNLLFAVTMRERLSHDHDHGRGIGEELAYGFYAGRSGQPLYKSCYTFNIHGLVRLCLMIKLYQLRCPFLTLDLKLALFECAASLVYAKP